MLISSAFLKYFKWDLMYCSAEAKAELDHRLEDADALMIQAVELSDAAREGKGGTLKKGDRKYFMAAKDYKACE